MCSHQRVCRCSWGEMVVIYLVRLYCCCCWLASIKLLYVCSTQGASTISTEHPYSSTALVSTVRYSGSATSRHGQQEQRNVQTNVPAAQTAHQKFKVLRSRVLALEHPKSTTLPPSPQTAHSKYQTRPLQSHSNQTLHPTRPIITTLNSIDKSCEQVRF